MKEKFYQKVCRIKGTLNMDWDNWETWWRDPRVLDDYLDGDIDLECILKQLIIDSKRSHKRLRRI
jgi:hypothetical protein